MSETVERPLVDGAPAWLGPVLQDADAGLTTRALASKYSLPQPSVSRWIKRQRDSESMKLESVSRPASESADLEKAVLEQSTAIASEVPLESIDRAEAFRQFNRGLRGVALEPGQVQLLKMALKDDLEPESESNPYAGTPTEELALRSLTLAVSVLGLVRVAAILREHAKAGTLDLGIDWEPKEEQPTTNGHLAAQPPPYKPESIETIEVSVAQPEKRIDAPVASDVETL